MSLFVLIQILSTDFTRFQVETESLWGKKSGIGRNRRFRHTTIGKAALSLVESALLAHESCF